ncbi:MAG TPA: biotin--[acetyl-CoA-carboxylase] ligase, partial [Candidatus Acidoferrum sp.]|nr:biotin--[acetyl-CoA-carboxylase] ligase [Candidatus Acidoferrum sp.]
TALALTETLLPYCPGEVRIKWPNDVLLAGRKVAGILTELSAEGNHINHIIVGVGINANQKAGDFPPELKDSATSLRRMLKRKVNRAELLRAFLYRLEREYLTYNKSGLKSAHARLKRYSALIGERITLHSGPHLLEGRAVDIDPNGALILETHGHRLTISAGEVTVAKE